MSDTVSVETNAARDAGALVAALHRGDVDSASLLLGFYSTPPEMAALVSSLAAIACAVLKTIDTIGEEITIVHGIPFVSSQQVLQSVLMRAAAEWDDGAFVRKLSMVAKSCRGCGRVCASSICRECKARQERMRPSPAFAAEMSERQARIGQWP